MTTEKKTTKPADKVADKSTDKKSKQEQIAEQEAMLKAAAARIVSFNETTKTVEVNNDEATKAYIGGLPEGLTINEVKALRRYDQNFAASVTVAATPHIVSAMQANDETRTVALEVPMATSTEKVQIMADRDNGLSIAITLPLKKTGNIKSAYEEYQSAIDAAFGEDA